jgi:predicted  nucleic acid-binding Zn-ribbon protein
MKGVDLGLLAASAVRKQPEREELEKIRQELERLRLKAIELEERLLRVEKRLP